MPSKTKPTSIPQSRTLTETETRTSYALAAYCDHWLKSGPTVAIYAVGEDPDSVETAALDLIRRRPTAIAWIVKRTICYPAWQPLDQEPTR